MTRTANLRRHHEAAMQLAGEVLDMLSRTAPTEFEVRQVSRQVARLAGLLRIHFAAEDKLLYPALMACDDAEAARTAGQFAAEMGSIGPAFDAYFTRWSSAGMVQSRWSVFVEETRSLFGALANRVTRENEVLYPMADRVLTGGRQAA